MNIYSDSLHTAMNFLSDKALNILNLLYIEENFNIRDTRQNLSVSSHFAAGQTLKDLTDSYSLMYFISALSVPTHYLNIQDYTNIVINLIMSCTQVSYYIEPDFR